MLNSQQLNDIAAAINDRVDIPLVGERQEAKLFSAALARLDAHLEVLLREYLGEEMLNHVIRLLDRQADEASRREALQALIRQQLAAPLVDRLNQRLDLPFLSEREEGRLLTLVLDEVVNQMAAAAIGSTDRRA
jgi:transcriptional regulator CtsR